MNAVVDLAREIGQAATTALAAVGAVTVAAVLSGALVVSVDIQASAPTEASTVPVAVCGSDAECAAYDRARGVEPAGYGTAGK